MFAGPRSDNWNQFEILSSPEKNDIIGTYAFIHACTQIPNEVRTHLSLDNNAPAVRSGSWPHSLPSDLGGLHHQYDRI